MRTIFQNGRRFAYDMIGAGPVSVILETGFGAEASEWQIIADEIATRATVFLYDRAGRGASDPPTGPRDTLEMHHELNKLLEASRVTPPFVLVGHSFGGVLMRLFADRRRGDVRGLVLVESMHSKQFDIIGAAIPESTAQEPQELTQMRQFWRRGWMKTESTPELIDLPQSLKHDATILTLGAVPLHVITAASFRNLHFFADQLAKERLQNIWDDLQNGLAQLSTETSHTQLSQSGHFVQRDAPGAIVEAVMPMLS
jgi:pimeloyl-ACP methyl ester carboxylesterase